MNEEELNCNNVSRISRFTLDQLARTFTLIKTGGETEKAGWDAAETLLSKFDSGEVRIGEPAADFLRAVLAGYHIEVLRILYEHASRSNENNQLTGIFKQIREGRLSKKSANLGAKNSIKEFNSGEAEMGEPTAYFLRRVLAGDDLDVLTKLFRDAVDYSYEDDETVREIMDKLEL